jgi:hypothetical protein
MNFNYSKKAFTLSSIVLLVLLTHHVLIRQCGRSRTSKNIILKCKVFSAEECMGYLGKDVISAGYQPLHITIENNSERFFSFSSRNISFKTISPEIVAQSVYSNTTKRIVGWGIAGLFIPLLWIPGIVHAGSSYTTNEKITQDFQIKAATDRILAPNTKIDGLLFVDIADFNTSWTLLLTDTTSGEIVTCAIDMIKNAYEIYYV